MPKRTEEVTTRAASVNEPTGTQQDEGDAPAMLPDVAAMMSGATLVFDRTLNQTPGGDAEDANPTTLSED